MNRMEWGLLLVLVSLCRIASAQEPAAKRVLLGIDVLEARGFDILQGKQVGLITNRTGVDSQGRRTIDVLAKAPRVKLIALFSTEHGIGGTAEAGQAIQDTIDLRTHLPVYSLYGRTERPTPEMLNAVDVLVFDIQDVGARFYTYLTTMGMAMEEAARREIDFVVLDRPNPLGGTILEGPVADPRVRYYTAYYAIPIRHGFTAGELAQWYNETAKIHAKLKIVPMAGWSRGDFWPQTGLRFVAPSPNIQNPAQALLYAGIGIFEATNLSVGRGTPEPFEVIGAPWIKGHNLIKRLRIMHIPGVSFTRTTFVPGDDLYQGQTCRGVRLTITDPNVLRPVDLFVQVACTLRELYPNAFQLRWPEVARMTGTKDFEKEYQSAQPIGAILELFHKSAAQFTAEREKYLLY